MNIIMTFIKSIARLFFIIGAGPTSDDEFKSYLDRQFREASILSDVVQFYASLSFIAAIVSFIVSKAQDQLYLGGKLFFYFLAAPMVVVWLALSMRIAALLETYTVFYSARWTGSLKTILYTLAMMWLFVSSLIVQYLIWDFVKLATR